MKLRLFRLCIGLAAARLCSTQVLQWQPSRKPSGTGWYPYVHRYSTGYTTPKRAAVTHRQTAAYTTAAPNNNIPLQGVDTNPISRSSSGSIAGGLLSDDAPFSAMVSDLSRAMFPVTTTESISTLQNTSVTVFSSALSVQINPSVAPSSGALLAGLLRQITNDGKSLSAKITVAASKTEFIRSIESTEPRFKQMFNDLGGSDIPTDNCRHSGRGFLNSIVTLVSCAIKSLAMLKAKVDIPDGHEPEFPSIDQDLEDIGDISSQLTNRGGEEQSHNEPSRSAKVSQSSATRDPATSPSSNPPPTSSSSSLSSITSTTSSINSSTTREILVYRTPIVGMPDSYALPASASEHILEIVGGALMSVLSTTNSSNSLFLTMGYSKSNLQTSDGPGKRTTPASIVGDTALSTKQISATIDLTASTPVPSITGSAVMNASPSYIAQETHPNPTTTTCIGQDCQDVSASGAPSCGVYRYGDNKGAIASTAAPWILACADDFCFGKHKMDQEGNYGKDYVAFRNREHWEVHLQFEWNTDPTCSHEDANLEISCKVSMSRLVSDCDGRGGCITGQCGRYCWAPS